MQLHINMYNYYFRFLSVENQSILTIKCNCARAYHIMGDNYNLHTHTE